MIEVKVGQHTAFVDDHDFEVVKNFSWFAVKKGMTIYALTTATPHRRMHRMILGLPKRAECVDHKNGVGLDNRRCNLRVGTQAQNLANKRAGVGFERLPSGRYRARLAKKQLGIFNTAEEARSCYLSALKVRREKAWEKEA